jgi:dTDP-4-dehydrorhamnose 3,5-epimerase
VSVNLSSEAESQYRRQQYGARPTIDGVSLTALERFTDDGGSMVELMRLEAGVPQILGDFRLAQVNYSCVQPGVVKAFHVHREQTDVWFVRPEDRMLVVLVDVRRGSPTEKGHMRIVLGDGKVALLRIPPGVAHGCRNLGASEAGLIYFTDRHFSAEPDRTDEGRLPWDFVGQEIWDVVRE